MCLCDVPLSAWQLQSIFPITRGKIELYIEMHYTVYMNRATNRMEQIGIYAHGGTNCFAELNCLSSTNTNQFVLEIDVRLRDSVVYP